MNGSPTALQPALRARLVLMFGVLAGASLMVTVLTTRSILLAQVHSETTATVEHRNAQFATFTAEAGQQSPGEVLTEFLSQTLPERGEVLIGIDGGKMITAHQPSLTLSKNTINDLVARTETSGTLQDPTYGQLVWATTVLAGPDSSSELLIVHSSEHDENLIARSIWTVVGIGTAGILLTALLAWWLSRSVFSPLARLRSEIIDADHEDRPIDANSIPGAETSDLARVIDTAIQRAYHRGIAAGKEV